jgi:hypothetical protein
VYVRNPTRPVIVTNLFAMINKFPHAEMSWCTHYSRPAFSLQLMNLHMRWLAELVTTPE